MNYREASKRRWNRASATSATDEDIKIRVLLRIADATEKMASSYAALENERDHHKRKHEWWRASNAALRGVITKQRKRIAELAKGDE